jgi:hypothetical protein
MSLTTNVFVAILWMGSATAAGSGGPDALWVQVNLHFEHSISSNAIAPIAKSEAAAIWRVYGVELLWSDCESDAALHLDVVVARKQLDPLFDRWRAALGLTNLDGAGGVNGPIRISFDRIESLLQFRSERVPLMHTQEIGRALGRVLAHELGHVLLGSPAYHDVTGLMRANFRIDDLARRDRRYFELTPDSAARLQANITALAVTKRATVAQ